ncbi:MAG: PhoD-like phosphatase [Thermosynechococcaceae cyanobacterium]
MLAGPILRKTESDAVTVWVALSERSSVRLSVYSTSNQGRQIEQLCLEGQSQTLKVGDRLHIIAVTATPSNAVLQPGQIYAYNLQFCFPDSRQPVTLHSENVLGQESISYFAHQLPTFALPPTHLQDLKIVHGSCRKPHGGGPDILPVLDDLLTRDTHNAKARTHQLFLTGDQIYGDDVADPFLWIALRLGPILMGWEELLPIERQEDGTDHFYSPKAWSPGQRTEIARQKCGFTAMVPNKPKAAKSHLFSFTEYCVAYLLAWSPVLWPSPEQILNANPMRDDRSKQWSRDASDMQTFVRGSAQVRRALANIPTYMICDDHDITDDWYLNRAWCNQVLSQPLGRCVVQNGLLAYALFQAWGNTPEQFGDAQPGGELRQAVEKWTQARGCDRNAWQDIGRYLGMPPIDEQTQQPQMQLEADILVLKRDPQALNWSYTVRSHCHEVLVLDTRTWRGYPKDTEGIAPPMLLCPSAFKVQIENPLQKTDKLNQNGAKIQATLLVMPTNLISLSIVDRVQELHWRQGKVFGNDVGDAWNFNEAALTQLLKTLSTHRDRIVILSGDIHYGGTVRLDHWERSGSQNLRSSLIIQLTSSAMKNAELATYLVHTRLKSLFPEPAEAWLGQQTQITWIPRQKATSTRLPSTQRWARRAQQPWPYQIFRNAVSWLWRNRWFQEGPEVVGHNNFGVVTWAEPQADAPQYIRHEIYWHPPWDMTRPVKSQYQVSFAKNPTPVKINF